MAVSPRTMTIRSPARRQGGRSRRGNRVGGAPPGPRLRLAASWRCRGFRQRRVTRIAATARQASDATPRRDGGRTPIGRSVMPVTSRQRNHGREHVGSPSSVGRTVPINQGQRVSSPPSREISGVAAAAWPAAGPVRATPALRRQVAQRGELPVTENLPDHYLDRSGQRDSQEGPEHAEQHAAE